MAVEQPGRQADTRRNKLSKPGVAPRRCQEQGLEGESKAGRQPRVLIIGALGRCGRGAVDLGAVDLCKQVRLPDENILK